MLQTLDQRRNPIASLSGWSSMRYVSMRIPSYRGLTRRKVLCGHVPYDGWDPERINDAILGGVRPYKPKAAAHLGLVDELWAILQYCWDERCEVRPELPIIRACLEEVTPFWHVRKDLPLTADDAKSLYPPSSYSISSSPTHTPGPSTPSPAPPSHLHFRHSYPQLSTIHHATPSLRPSQP